MLSWIGTIASIAGSFLVALKIAALGYAAFIVGSISWLIVGFKKRDKALITLNLFFLIANFIGVYNYAFI